MAKRAKKPHRGNIISIRIRELPILFSARYRGEVLSDDDAGLHDALLMCEHLWRSRDGPKRMKAFLDKWAPWLSREDARDLMQRAAESRITWTAEELGEALRLTLAERQSLGIKTIRAVDDSEAARLERIKAAKRERERRRYWMNHPGSAHMRKSPEIRAHTLSPRSWAALRQLNGGGEVSVTTLLAGLGKDPLFADCAGATRRRRLLRAIEELVQKGEVLTRTETGHTGLPTMFVRRA